MVMSTAGHWNNLILWEMAFLHTGQLSTFCEQSQHSWWPQRKAVFLGSVRHIGHMEVVDRTSGGFSEAINWT